MGSWLERGNVLGLFNDRLQRVLERSAPEQQGEGAAGAVVCVGGGLLVAAPLLQRREAEVDRPAVQARLLRAQGKLLRISKTALREIKQARPWTQEGLHAHAKAVRACVCHGLCMPWHTHDSLQSLGGHSNPCPAELERQRKESQGAGMNAVCQHRAVVHAHLG